MVKFKLVYKVKNAFIDKQKYISKCCRIRQDINTLRYIGRVQNDILGENDGMKYVYYVPDMANALDLAKSVFERNGIHPKFYKSPIGNVLRIRTINVHLSSCRTRFMRLVSEPGFIVHSADAIRFIMKSVQKTR